MSRFKNTGITFHEDDRGKGPFKIRIGGTNDFIEKLVLNYYGRFGSPDQEKVFTCNGWDNPSTLLFDTMTLALEAARHAYRIEGFNISIEPTKR